MPKTMTKLCSVCGKDHEKHYIKENFPSLQYGNSNSPNPPHMRGFKSKEQKDG